MQNKLHKVSYRYSKFMKKKKKNVKLETHLQSRQKKKKLQNALNPFPSYNHYNLS